MTTERWKPVVGYEDRYHVSDHGRILSLNFAGSGQPGLMKPSIDSDGYFVVKLCNGTSETRKLMKVHRLVAVAFVEGFDENVNHDDGNKQNNHYKNLEWSSIPNNLHHMRRQLGKGAVETPIEVISIATGERRAFRSQHEAARTMNLAQGSLQAVLKGRCHQTQGYRAEYVHGSDK